MEFLTTTWLVVSYHAEGTQLLITESSIRWVNWKCIFIILFLFIFALFTRLGDAVATRIQVEPPLQTLLTRLYSI